MPAMGIPSLRWLLISTKGRDRGHGPLLQSLRSYWTLGEARVYS